VSNEQLDKSPETIALMFNRVASHYDFMNDAMSGFSHRRTRHVAINMSKFAPGQKALDLATGTGDFAFLLSKRADHQAEVVGIDISDKMLAVAKVRARKQNLEDKVIFKLADIQALPYADNTFDVCTIGYGIRNVPDAVAAMQEVLRVTKPGGRFLIVEATPPENRYLRFLSQFHFSKFIPLVARILSPDASAYKYFANSVSAFPVASKFANMMKSAGWGFVYYKSMYLGTVAVFLGIKL
jgi:demethylmenaquinone methyltransferase / 2-methoxy-6-polyprenyl-1,4-benzoquinol methylase